MPETTPLPRPWPAYAARAARWLVGALGLLALALGLVWSAVHFVIVPRIDVLRPWLLEQAQQRSGLNLQLDAIEVTSNGWVPELALRGVRLLDAQGTTALALPEVHVAFSSASLLIGEVEQIALEGADVEVRRDAQGQIWVAGLLAQSPDKRDNAALDWLFRQKEWLVRGGRVRWVDALRSAAPLDFTDVTLQLRNSARSHTLQLEASPPASWGDRMHLSGQFSRPLLSSHPGRLEDWRGQAELAVSRLDVAALAPYTDAAKGIRSAHGALQVALDVQAARVAAATVDLALDDLDASLGAQGHALQMRRLTGRVAWSRLDGDGMQYAVKGLQGQTRDGLRWPASDLTVQLWGSGAASGAHGSLSVGQLDLGGLAQLAGRMPLDSGVRAALAGLQPKGQVQAASLQWQGPWDAPTDYKVKAQLHHIGLTPYAAAGFPGLGAEGLDADMEATPSGGTAKWAIKQGALAVPLWLDDGRVAVDAADATLRWSWVDGRLRLEMPHLQFANADAAGELALVWNAPRAASAGNAMPGKGLAAAGLGELSLDGKLTRLVPARLPRYLPTSMDRDVRNYVRDAFSGGQLGPVTIKVKGDLDQFPFSKGRAGVFQLATTVSNMNCAYALAPKQKGAPTWPALTQLYGDLALDRDTLTLTNGRANWVHPASPGAVVPITRGTVRITQLYDHPAVALNLEGITAMADALTIVNRSAAGALMGNALSRSIVSGSAAYKLNMQVPLDDPGKTLMQGSLLLAGNDFQYSPDMPRLVRVRGTLGFTDNSINLGGLQASALGGDMRLDGTLQFSDAAWDGGKNRVRVQGTLTSQGLKESKDLAPWAAVLALLEGQTAYSADLAWRAGAPQIQISSDLQGMALALPAPLGKTAPSVLPMRADWTSGDTGLKASPRNDTIRWSLGRVAQVLLQRDTSGPQARLLRGAVVLGEAADAPPSLPAQGLQLQVDTAVLDLDQWTHVINQLAPPTEVKLGSESPYLPSAFKLQAKQLLWGGRQWDRLAASGRREGAVWRLDVDAAQLAGKLEFGPAGSNANGGSRLSARLSRLSLEASTANDVQNMLDAPATSLPALDVVVDALEMYGKKLGRMQATAVNVGSGTGKAEWRLQQLLLTVPEATFSANGVWGSVSNSSAPPVNSGPQAQPAPLSRKPGGDGRRTELNFKLDIADAGVLLARFGMANVVRGGSGKLEGTMGWAGQPLNLDYPSLSGRLNLDIAKGQFLRAEPGVARLLGVLSLQSLPRRLLLDFRDVFSDGFEFSYVRGDVTTEQGIARSDNLQMKGVAAAVLMDGSTDIARETQKIKVLVVPELDTGAATLLTALANPVAGLYTLVASTLLRQPIQDASTQELLVEGTWQAPKVSKIDRRTGKPLP